MPIYEYRCSECGHRLEALQRLADAPLLECPACSKKSLVKLISAVGFQLKGSGWYATDFKHSGSKPPDKAPESNAGESAGSDAKSDATPSAEKSGAKPAAAASSDSKTASNDSKSDSKTTSTDSKTSAAAPANPADLPELRRT